jgi:hypothetical protein
MMINIIETALMCKNIKNVYIFRSWNTEEKVRSYWKLRRFGIFDRSLVINPKILELVVINCIFLN